MKTKNLTYFLSVLLGAVVLLGCGQSTEKQDSEEAEEQAEATSEDVDQLTYQDVVAMVYDDAGEGIEWHGEEMPNELVDFLTIAEAEPCGDGDCGKRLTLTNTSDGSITTIVRGDYDIEGDVGYIPRKYVIDAGQTLMIGCSHLCYGGESYEFARTIVASAYTESE